MRTLSRIHCFRVNDPLTVSERFRARLVYLSLRYQIDSYRLVTRRHCLEKKRDVVALDIFLELSCSHLE